MNIVKLLRQRQLRGTLRARDMRAGLRRVRRVQLVDVGASAPPFIARGVIHLGWCHDGTHIVSYTIDDNEDEEEGPVFTLEHWCLAAAPRARLGSRERVLHGWPAGGGGSGGGGLLFGAHDASTVVLCVYESPDGHSAVVMGSARNEMESYAITLVSCGACAHCGGGGGGVGGGGGSSSNGGGGGGSSSSSRGSGGGGVVGGVGSGGRVALPPNRPTAARAPVPPPPRTHELVIPVGGEVPLSGRVEVRLPPAGSGAASVVACCTGDGVRVTRFSWVPVEARQRSGGRSSDAQGGLHGRSGGSPAWWRSWEEEESRAVDTPVRHPACFAAAAAQVCFKCTRRRYWTIILLMCTCCCTTRGAPEAPLHEYVTLTHVLSRCARRPFLVVLYVDVCEARARVHVMRTTRHARTRCTANGSRRIIPQACALPQVSSASTLVLLVMALHTCGSVQEHRYELDLQSGACIDSAHDAPMACGRLPRALRAHTDAALLARVTRRPPVDIFRAEWRWTNFAVLRGESLKVLTNHTFPVDIVHEPR